MGRQLDAWRSLLPRSLQWLDSDKFGHPTGDPTDHRLPAPLFTPYEGGTPITYKANLDILTAELRTRFYHARFMLYRPFAYKVLHFPALVTEEDASCCVFAIQAACSWPILMVPPRGKKRVVPHLFTWIQNSIGVLLILRMTRDTEVLQRICAGRVSDEEIESTTVLMLNWLDDSRQVDATAQWAWTILEPIFAVNNEV